MKRKSIAADQSLNCPCGSGRGYGRCCEPYHRGEAPAADAEVLMRSRYVAYSRGDEAYLMATWHPSTRPVALNLRGETPATVWLGLSVKTHRSTGPDTAVVEFVARYRVGGGSAQRLHEVSRFVREDGRWFYLDGSFPDERSVPNQES